MAREVIAWECEECHRLYPTRLDALWCERRDKQTCATAEKVRRLFSGEEEVKRAESGSEV